MDYKHELMVAKAAYEASLAKKELTHRAEIREILDEAEEQQRSFAIQELTKLKRLGNEPFQETLIKGSLIVSNIDQAIANLEKGA